MYTVHVLNSKLCVLHYLHVILLQFRLENPLWTQSCVLISCIWTQELLTLEEGPQSLQLSDL